MSEQVQSNNSEIQSKIKDAILIQISGQNRHKTPENGKFNNLETDSFQISQNNNNLIINDPNPDDFNVFPE